jgi:hypothetical protein
MQCVPGWAGVGGCLCRCLEIGTRQKTHSCSSEEGRKEGRKEAAQCNDVHQTIEIAFSSFFLDTDFSNAC